MYYRLKAHSWGGKYGGCLGAVESLLEGSKVTESHARGWKSAHQSQVHGLLQWKQHKQLLDLA